MNLYRIDVRIYGTAYIRAADADEAKRAAQALDGAAIYINSADMEDAEITGEDYSELPEISLSPAMTVKGPDDNDTPEQVQ